jgi:lysophospholipase L1-like esterase
MTILASSVRTVLCFGDSNTWGYDPATERRFPREVRWPGRLQAALGEDWHVVEEGLNSRTATLDSPIAPGKNGLTYLGPCLDSHAPLDAVVIALGTNDLAERYGLTATDVARAAAYLAWVVSRSEAGIDGRPPLPILACPPRVGDTTWGEDWAGAPAKSALLPERFRTAAAEGGFELVDLGEATRFSAIDGIHLEADGHAAVAALVERTLRRLFP